MKVQMQCLLAATAQNMKKMALLALFYWLTEALKGLSEQSNRQPEWQKTRMG